MYQGLKLYYKLGTCSKRAIRRRTWKGGKAYQYKPRITLCRRLADETGMTVIEVRNQLIRERLFILRHSQYF